MKKFIKRLFLFILIIIVAAAIVVSVPVIRQGKRMYTMAVSEVSIQQKVSEIKSAPNYTTIDNISDDFLQMLLTSEDRRFYKHSGIDIIAIARAAYTDIKEGALVEGGSTITQQLAKNMYYSFDKIFARKIAEVYTAFDIEKLYTKDEILEMYCNIVYFGDNCYGVQEACRHYFGSDANEITKDEAKELVETLHSPSINNPSTM